MTTATVCDSCRVAVAQYKVLINAGFLYFCGHHYRANRNGWHPDAPVESLMGEDT